MSNTIEVTLPDVGDFDQVEIIEILVAVGDQVEAEDSLLTLESDKASMEIPSPHGGRVTRINVAVGEKISKGDPVLTLEQTSDATQPEIETQAEEKSEAVPDDTAAPSATSDADIHAEVLVIGAGPGGYTAAFRAADLGRKTVLIEKYADLGGVCLNVGCIPSKALLHTADVINEAAELTAMGVDFGKPKIDLDKLRAGKQRVVKKLTGGLAGMAKQRKVTTVHGVAQFMDANSVSVATQEGSTTISFDHCIIAVGSRAVQIPQFPNDDPRLIDSTGALALEDVPKKLLVIGGGIIGLEMATVYSTLGSNIDIVEMQNQLMPGADKDLVRPLQKRLAKQVGSIMVETKVAGIKTQKNGLKVAFEGKHAPDKEQLYDRVLVAVGRSPNGHTINTEAAGVNVDEHGFIPVDQHMRTNVAHIYAIGDVVGNPMLAHKATHEAKVAAEVIAGLPSLFDPMSIPSVAYTDPEVAWMGMTEIEAKQQGVEYEKGLFPWAASGRALGIGRDEGLTKLLFDADSKRIIGAGIVGPNAGELIGEAMLALEMGADMEDIGLTIHPHPTLVETICLAAEMAEGTITDLMPPRKRG
ncbi:MAG: dihydrolipoyl dehydrogenase [Gammaproteobacteria bacterium]|nr:dihydrolipoyl dehydrogenase [Gammaproteobacteria bacterium]